VTGAAAGTGLAGTVTVVVTVTWGVTVAVAVVEPAAGVLGDEALPDPGEPSDPGETPDAGEPPEVTCADAVPEVRVGEKDEGGAVDAPEVHAETATGTRRVRAAQQRAVSLALNGVPAIVPRTFMDPSSCAGLMTIVFPFPAAETGIRERKTRDRSGRRPRRRKQVPKAPAAITAGPVSGADVQWPVRHRNIRLTE
jgi:hypothetical protein